MTIQKTTIKRRCSNCFNRDITYEINIGDTEINLCDKCRQELISTLTEATHEVNMDLKIYICMTNCSEMEGAVHNCKFNEYAVENARKNGEELCPCGNVAILSLDTSNEPYSDDIAVGTFGGKL